MDSVQGRDPQRVLEVLAKAEEAAERRLADVDSWYEQAQTHLADFAATVQRAGERLTSQVESLRGTIPGARLTGTPPLPTLPPSLAAPAELAAAPDPAQLDAPESAGRPALSSASGATPDAPAGTELSAVDASGAVAESTGAAESTGDPVADSLREYQIRLLANSEYAADQLLGSAEEQAAQIVQDARAQADQVMRSAKFHSERMIGNARMEAAVTGRRVAELRALERKLRDSIKGILSGDDPELDYQPSAELAAAARPRPADQPLPAPHPQSVDHLVAAPSPWPLDRPAPGPPSPAHVPEPHATDRNTADRNTADPASAHPAAAYQPDAGIPPQQAADTPLARDLPPGPPAEPVRYPPSSSPVLPGEDR